MRADTAACAACSGLLALGLPPGAAPFRPDPGNPPGRRRSRPAPGPAPLAPPALAASSPASGDLPPSTPCSRICRYNRDVYGGQVCVGCHREQFEIACWGGMTEMERYYCLLDAADRAPAGGDGDGSVTREELLRQAGGWERLHHDLRDGGGDGDGDGHGRSSPRLR